MNNFVVEAPTQGPEQCSGPAQPPEDAAHRPRGPGGRWDWLESLRPALDDTTLEQALREESEGRSALDFHPGQSPRQGSELLDALRLYHGLPSICLAHYHPDAAALALIPTDVARRLRMMPLFFVGGHLYVAVTEPLDLEAQDYIRQITRMIVEPVLVLRPDLERAYSRLSFGLAQSAEAMGAIAGGERSHPARFERCRGRGGGRRNAHHQAGQLHSRTGHPPGRQRYSPGAI